MSFGDTDEETSKIRAGTSNETKVKEGDAVTEPGGEKHGMNSKNMTSINTNTSGWKDCSTSILSEFSNIQQKHI